ncbi:hypothetical protein ACFLSZ_03005 [Candidatus Bipolaricaulota bacterium]
MNTRNPRILQIGAIGSLVLLAVLLMLQTLKVKPLELDAQWVAVAALPAIIALFAGGYVTKFTGFGMELETALKTPVTSLDLTASEALADIPGDEKRSIMYLNQMPREKAHSIRWLLFTSDRREYYGAHAVNEYLRRLPNLDFFEVRSREGDPVCYLPTSVFRQAADPGYMDPFDAHRIEQFIEALEDDRVPQAFPESAVTLRVASSDSLANVLKSMRAENAPFAAVMSRTGRYLGVVYRSEVESRIADFVLTSVKDR